MIRYINLGQINGFEVAAEHELTKHIEFECPVITSMSTLNPVVTMTGDYEVGKYLNADNIPKGTELVRIYSPGDISGSMFLDTNSYLVHLHIKDADYKGDIRKTLIACVSEVMRDYKVFVEKSSHRRGSNDLVVKEQERYKKVSGTWSHSYREGWTTYGLLICFQPDYDVMGAAFRMDTQKMISRDAETIQDAVTGLGNVENKDRIIRQIVDLIVFRLEQSIVESILSDEEKVIMDRIVKEISTDDWIYRAIR